MAILARENDALSYNPPSGDEELSTNGSDWMWAVTAIYVVSFIAFFATSFIARSGEKIFHYLFTIALLVGSISYFAMASDIGYEVVNVINYKPELLWTREILYAKYINWVVSFPAVTIALGLVSGVSWATIAFNVALSWTWVVSYLICAFTESSQYKWGFYAFGTIAWALLAFNTIFYGAAGAKRVGIVRDHALLSGWLNLLWLLYPIAFGLSDGGNRIGVTPGSVFFGVLDVLMIPLLSFAFLILSAKWDYNKMNLAFTRYGRVAVAGDFPEKTAPAPAGGVAGETV